MKHLKHPFWISSIALSFWANLTTASAQIVPDNTLPVNSQVTGCPVCLIEGGTVRGVNLFHSFEEFSVQTGGEAFFNNALDIENIFSRVTGANISGIDGWIRANSTANLFLINPNGIIFGENARLDVGGSFVASTANSFTFPDGSEFSATNPQAPPLLTINITPGLQYGANSPGGTIANAGKLTAGQDLTLAADNLDLQGQLSAGRDLTLKAQDTVTIRDSLTHPFIASAEGNLLVQGNQTIDIFALNHPDSGLFSGGDMVLRSASPVWGDAHYWSGGNFRIEQLDGNLGDLASPEDPVIRALGDVLLNRYTGASLHIFAGGWVAIGTVTITATDPTEGIRENVTLSDGTVLAIDGKVQPTLDVRAGLDPNAVGSPIGLTGNNFFDIGGNFDDIPDSADIAIGTVFVHAANGVVFLTNQYQPNPSLSGDIEVGSILTNDFIFTGNAGSVIIDSRGAIEITNQIDSSSTSGNAGNITLIANDIVSLTGSFIVSATDGVGTGGDTRIQSGSVLLKEGAVVSTATLGAGDAGNLTVETGELLVRDGSQLIVSTFGTGNGGELNVNATGTVAVADGIIRNNVEAGATGSGGDIKITASSVSMMTGAVISASTWGEGDAGQVVIRATDSILLDGENSQGLVSGIFNTVALGSQGNSGGVNIESGSLTLNNGVIISASTLGEGDAGSVVIRATDSILLDGESSLGFGSSVLSTVESGAKGNSGGVEIESGSLTLSNGAGISATTFGEGDAGQIIIRATDSLLFDGESSLGNVSGVFSRVQPTANGNSGGVDIETDSLTINNGALVNASTGGEGDAGQIVIRATDSLLFDGESSLGFGSGVGSEVELGAKGNSGGVDIESGSLNLNNGARISATTFGEGDAGQIVIRATDSLLFDGESSLGFSSGVFSTVESGAQGNSGGVDIKTGSLTLSNGARIDATTFGEGDAGQIIIRATDSLLFDGESSLGNVSGVFSRVQPTANGNSGGVDIETDSLTINNGALVNVSTGGEGDAGQIAIRATDSLLFDGESSLGFSSGVGSTVESGAQGNSGGVDIKTGSLTLSNGALIDATTLGEGDAGSVVIRATDSILFDGESSLVNVSGVFSRVQPTAQGNSGGVDIETDSLTINNGALVNASTGGEGDAGQIIIRATDSLLFDGESSLGFGSGVGSEVELGAKGNSGGVEIETRTLTLNNGAGISASTLGEGDAGSVIIRATDNILLDGENTQGFISGISSLVESEAKGNSGGVEIATRTLTLNNGAGISASTLGEGDAGSVVIRATDNILVEGENSQGFNSSVLSTVESGAKGNSGGVEIESQSLTLNNGAIISASTLGEGDAGQVVIRATDSIILDGENRQGFGSGVGSTVESGAKGNSGGVEIESGSLTLNNGAGISATTFGEGDAGSVVIRATDSILLDGENTQGFISGISSIVESEAKGNSGGVEIATRTLTLNNGAGISASTLGEGDAGSVVIRATDSLILDGENTQGFNSGVFSEVASGAQGNSGGVEIESQSLTLNNGAEISATTFGEGDAGQVVIRATDNILLDGENTQGLGSGVFSAVELGAQGNSGGVEIESGSLTLNNGAIISATTFGEGDAGQVVIRAADNILLDGENSQGFGSSVLSEVASGAQGNSGGVDIESQSLTLNNGAGISASTLGEGDAGSVVIRATDNILLDGESRQGFGSSVLSEVASGAQGNSGGVDIESQSLRLNNGAGISATTWGKGDAGQVLIRATDSIVLDGENSQGLGSGVFSAVESGAQGNSGGVEIESGSLTLNNGAGISATTFGEGDAGSVVIRATDSILLDGENTQGFISGISSIVESGAQGSSGGVEIESGSLTLNNGAGISASTLGEGDAGSVVIRATDSILLEGKNTQGFISGISSIVESGAQGNSGGVEIATKTLTLNNGAGISAETHQTGTAGSLSINATESVDLNGVGGLSVEATQGGIAGNLTVNTGRMAIRDGAIVTVSSPSGQAGNLTIQANSLQLDQGQLTAETGISGVEGGANISLQNLDTLIMTNESLISAKASGDANGGNIDIESIFLLALPPEGVNGSDIIASAERGDGGRITITGEGIFGIEERPAIPGNRTNDIDASSQFGNPGQVITNVSLDPSRGLTQLPSTLVDPSGQINRTCAASNRQSQFTVTGRGGLPENPTDLFSPDLVQDDFGTVIPREEDEEIEGQVDGNNSPISHPPKQIIEAQGWIIDAEGNVVLTAYVPNGTPHGGWQNSVNCQVSAP